MVPIIESLAENMTFIMSMYGAAEKPMKPALREQADKALLSLANAIVDVNKFYDATCK